MNHIFMFLLAFDSWTLTAKLQQSYREKKYKPLILDVMERY